MKNFSVCSSYFKFVKNDENGNHIFEHYNIYIYNSYKSLEKYCIKKERIETFKNEFEKCCRNNLGFL